MAAAPLLVPLVLLLAGARSWQQRHIRRARRDLPTRLQRLLGPDPDFAPPEDAPDDLLTYAALHRRAGRVVRLCWMLAGVYLVALLALDLKGHL